MQARDAGGWLADELASALGAVVGSVERAQVCALLDGSPRVRLDTDCVRAVSETLDQAPGSIERNLDRLALPGGPSAWIEYPRADGRVGCLMAAEPNGDGHVACFVAWQRGDPSDGPAPLFHSYAILHWDLAHMASAAARASGGPGARERLEGLGSASVPPGLRAEMETWQELEGDAVEEALAVTRRQVLAEHSFLLGAVLLLDSDAVRLGDESGGGARPAWTATLEGRVARWPRRAGFSRTVLGDRLLWRLPAAGRRMPPFRTAGP